MNWHTLKCWPEFFEPLYSGTKNFEVRKNDRNFKVGDVLLLQEYLPTQNSFTGREATRRVSFVLNGEDVSVKACGVGIQPGFVVLGFEKEMKFPDDWFALVPVDFQRELLFEVWNPMFEQNEAVTHFGLTVGVMIDGEKWRHAVKIEGTKPIECAYKALVVWAYERKFGKGVWNR